MLFSLLKHHLDLNITDTALKVSRSLYCFTTCISHGVENYFPRLCGTGISDAIFIYATQSMPNFYKYLITQPMGVNRVMMVIFDPAFSNIHDTNLLLLYCTQNSCTIVVCHSFFQFWIFSK